MKEKDIKLLWGRAANRCSFPGCVTKLTQNSKSVVANVVLGEQAHIVAEELQGPRGNSVLAIGERNSYLNLILLCPTHHTLIDKNVEDYPVEKLHMIKQEHELWVEGNLSRVKDAKETAQEMIYADLIDAAVEECLLKEWKIWTSWALSPTPQWRLDGPTQLLRFREKILRAPWPGTLPELEITLNLLSKTLYEAVQVFKRHCEEREDILWAHKFYKISEWDEERYHKLVKEYDDWVDECHQWILESTKAANWFAEIVRRDINPLFFAIEGKFLVSYGPDSNLQYTTSLLEYTADEKKEKVISLERKPLQ